MTVGVDVDCGGGSFDGRGSPYKRALTAEGAHIAGELFLGCREEPGSQPFVGNGLVRMIGVRVGDWLDFTGARFEPGSVINLESAKVELGFLWRGIQGNVPQLLLNHANVGPLYDDERSWPERNELVLDGFCYARIDSSSPNRAEDRLKWLGRQPAGKFLPQPYEQLAKVLKESGDTEGWQRVMFSMENDRLKRGGLGFMRKVLWWLRWATVGYGYKLSRAFWWALGLLFVAFVFAHLGYMGGAMVPTDDKAFNYFQLHCLEPRAPSYYPPFNQRSTH